MVSVQSLISLKLINGILAALSKGAKPEVGERALYPPERTLVAG